MGRLPKPTTKPDLLHHEGQARLLGFSLIAGVDEAGRGPLAGPVVAAALILHADAAAIPGVGDSKALSARRRAALLPQLMADPQHSHGIGIASVAEIDEINILRATHLAMRRALEALAITPHYALVDGLPVQGLPCPHSAIVKGDALSYSIAAASIIAKETRDRLMLELDEQFPAYGFASHMGYGTAAHLVALRRHGPCSVHRRSFAPVRELVDGPRQPSLFIGP